MNVPDYDLTRLGSRAFEQLIVDLGRSEIGAGMEVFGDGPDGGREATFTGTIRWASTSLAEAPADSAAAVEPGTEPEAGSLAAAGGSTDDDVWNGYTVIQSKYKLDPAPRPMDNAVWLQGQIRDEIGHWVKAAREGTRTRLPDYLIFVTNVDLSAVAKTGGIDTVRSYIAGLLGPGSDAYKAGVRVRAFKVWHGDQVRSMIDTHQSVRWAFDGLLTIGDVLAALQAERGTQLGTNSIEDPLRQELLAGLASDRWIRLADAGGPGDAKLYIDDVGVDIPATFNTSLADGASRMNAVTLAAESRTIGVTELAGHAGTVGAIQVRFAMTTPAVRHVLERGDTVLRPRQAQWSGLPGIVLVGGPGQGKTTLSQLLAQAYRAALLDDADLAPAAREQVDATKAALDRLGLTLPRNRRWPIRVDLAKYAEELATGAETSLLWWLAQLVSRRAAPEVTASQLHSWLRVAPWVLVLDGLDEVPSLEARLAVYEKLEAFWTAADDLDADLLMIVTTRPTGYDERLPDDRYQHLQLQPLPPADATELAERISAKRFEQDEARRAEVVARMRAAAADPTTARLFGTPLQVTIMSMIVEKYPTLPPDRYTLYNLYYETLLEREIAKGIAVSRFLSDNRSYINRLHERVGLALQIRSEAAAAAEAVLPPAELRKLAHEYLLERGFEAGEADSIAEQLVTAALSRLVLLVPREDGVGFEIRTLQELMAARSLVEGTDEQVVERLKLIAHSPHWRHTWLLAAGALLERADRFEQLLPALLRSFGQGAHPLERVSPAPELAAAILADGLAQRRPRLKTALVQAVLSVRDHAPARELRPIASMLNMLMDETYRTTVSKHLEGAPGLPQRATAAALVDVMDQLLSDTQSGRRQTLQLVRDQLSLTDAEAAALDAFLTHTQAQSAAQVGRPAAAVPLIGADQSVVDTLVAAVADLDADGTVGERLAAGLVSLAPVRFRVTESEPSFAVLRSAPAANSSALLDVMADEDVATALDLALGGLPAGFWPLSALVARTAHLARSRRPVGTELEKLMASAAAAG